MASIMLLEQVGQVAADQRLSTDSLVESAIKSWTAELEQDARPVRQAPMFTIAILMSLEMTLARTNTDSGLRFACFMVLLMVWGALRCDDLQSIDPATVSIGTQVPPAPRQDIWAGQEARCIARFRLARGQSDGV